MHNFLHNDDDDILLISLFKSHNISQSPLRPRWRGGRWAARWGWLWWWTACTRSGTAGQSPSPRTSSQPPPPRPRPPASPAELSVNMIMWVDWNHLYHPIFMANLKDTRNIYVQFMFKISILYFDASKFTSLYWFPFPTPFKLFSITNWISFTFSVIILISFKIKSNSFWSGPTDFASSKTAGLYAALEKNICSIKSLYVFIFMKPDIIEYIILSNDIWI